MSDIMGYTWDEIKTAQQGGTLGRTIDRTKPMYDDEPHLTNDKALLAEHGVEGLKNKGFFGTLDRLYRHGLIDKV